MRVHRKVWVWWGRWWAVQFYAHWSFGIGVHLDCTRPYFDLHLGTFIVSVGRNPVITAHTDKHRGSCRGFFFEPIL